MRTVTELLLWWGLLLLLNTVLISSVTPLEVAVGGGIALLGALGALAVRRASGATPGGPARLAHALRAFPWTLLADTGRLALAVLSPAHRRGSGFRTLRLAPGTGRAWAAALFSATPGGYVVATEDGTLTVHALGREVSSLERALTDTTATGGASTGGAR
ncbi:Na+/H+ ion antiporter subunit [Streptomyces sp. 1114.5]|uniref:Na+/H+ antiporter subunit E n=1 Tax=Streptomyces sp. 1114.5 TaxID=1938830 RepID=UPI000EB44A05|nr:Na+/H+ antiporter subunit E [Streptomyces sp. 1114.5]RKT09457.1 Na+/H+ ion antiporter subunit [Streptomyces sp. 1114.5]